MIQSIFISIMKIHEKQLDELSVIGHGIEILFGGLMPLFWEVWSENIFPLYKNMNRRNE
jgi:hypothetical protein